MPRRRWIRAGVAAVVLLIAVYLLCVFTLNVLWTHYEHHQPMQGAPKRTRTKQGIPGDPLNVGLIGTESEIVQAMLKSEWLPADPTTVRSSLKIAASVVFDRSYPTAPVSNLYLWGRQQDLAFERPAGRSAKERNHVRFWRSDELGRDGKPLWIGAATFDQGVGVSHRTAAITHHIAPDIDAERDRLFADLAGAGGLVTIFQVTGVGPTISGRNGGGDRYFTDGEINIGILAEISAPHTASPAVLPNGPTIRWKTRLWNSLRPWLR
jgi:hypothetical protein